jgi:subtilisin family serine protease
MDTLYKYKYFGSKVLVFVLDTGIRQTHSEFGGRASCGWTIFPGDNCDDLQGHGTHVAGIVGGRTYGVAKSTNLVAVKVLNNAGSGTISNVIAGINYVIGKKVADPKTPMIINMSLGGGFNLLVNGAVQVASAMGVVVVVAAGNSNKDACNYSPASAASAITVGATDKPQKVRRRILWWYIYSIRDVRALFSNWGPCVDIFAPGVNIRSAAISSSTASITLSGTSMAAPFVAGVAALHLEKNPALLPASVRAAILADALLNQICKFPWYYGGWSPCPPLNGAPNRLLGKASLLI